jgi:hypothetical protein
MLLIVVTWCLPQNLKKKTSCTHHLPSQLKKKKMMMNNTSTCRHFFAFKKD